MMQQGCKKITKWPYMITLQIMHSHCYFYL